MTSHPNRHLRSIPKDGGNGRYSIFREVNILDLPAGDLKGTMRWKLNLGESEPHKCVLWQVT